MRKLDKPADIFTAIAQSAREKEVSGGVKDAKDDVMEEEGEESGEVIAKVTSWLLLQIFFIEFHSFSKVKPFCVSL